MNLDMNASEHNIQSAMLGLWSKVAEMVPNILSAILILLIGYLISKVVMKVSEKILKKLTFDAVSDRAGVHEMLRKVGIKRTSSEIISVFVFWLLMLTFIVSAAETLSFENVTKTINSFINYLPNVIGASFIFVIGLMASNFIANLIQGVSGTVNSKYFQIFGTIVKSVLFVVVTVLAVGQLQIETGLLDNILQIILVATGAILALSLGFGTREIARAITAGMYARDLFKKGSQIQVGAHKGKVLEVGTVTTMIESSGKVIHLPNEMLIQSVVEVQSSGSQEE